MKYYTHLSQEERENLYILLDEWKNQKEISRELWRNESTISREIKRNSTVLLKSRNNTREKTKEDYHYLPDRAQSKYLTRRKLAWWRPPLKNPDVYNYVVSKLLENWSPDIIVGTMLNEYPNNESMRISHETIYDFIYTKKWEELKLKYHLIRAHKRRKKKTGRKVRRVNIPERVDISVRPKQVEKRKEFGHWEWDSILSVRPTKSAIRTEVERKSRFILAKKIKRKTADFTKKATLQLYKPLPIGSVKTITWDNGSEHTQHKAITDEMGITIYFAHPYHSWERWTNEHANWMIRRYFPKWTNFDLVTDKQLQAVIDKINNRPRKILKYKTPKQIFNACLAKIKNCTWNLN
jgi:transposase, IS30 family